MDVSVPFEGAHSSSLGKMGMFNFSKLVFGLFAFVSHGEIYKMQSRCFSSPPRKLRR